MIVAAAPATHCPDCRTLLVTERGAQPWCPACEWNLDRYEPDRHSPELGWRWLDRLTHRVAYRLTARQYAALAGRPVDRPGTTPATVVLLGTAVLLLAADAALLAADAALLAAGCWLIVADFPSLRLVPGVLAVLLAVALRPRLGRRDPTLREVTRDQAPTLFALVDEVAVAVGAPAPHVVTVDADFNAFAGAVGLRRRRVLSLGLSLWGALPPQQRVALLGHELGHFVNGDVRRGPLTSVPMTTFGTLADVLRPTDMPARAGGLAGIIGGLLHAVVLGALRFLVRCGHLVLVWIGLREAQRAEYLADELAARAGGSTAAAQLADTLTATDTMTMVVRREARKGGDAAAWRAAADQARRDVAARLPRLRQLSVRDDVSLFASHPPAGLRARMIESRPAHPPAVLLDVATSARIDAELATAYAAARRDLAAS
ncbi:M48 family metallopeptidase [Planosporangium sp. 12N6]|uniref:M48 family metallopeptidase n=1 Tax=Planosporangium spinosum TaxID=3402278 RepID=UPI003CEBF6D0